ncbi:unnamed protein product [Notodromas monacha]|uniref:C2H2-type domain-containing protein n=1 Tax=Notodromas monacha TaxID=399045 RepID=A0A7R9BQU6_9CRUS|nr:unnamed protein product [Notodromas monacha]CAG0918634.1 unnamed protein product [Notodromas monacha]
MDSNGTGEDLGDCLDDVGGVNGSAALDYAVSHVDGTVVCKLCGEFLPSRMHWYRHKYRVHQVRMYMCKKCNTAFKSKRGLDNHSVLKHHASPSARIQGCPDRVIADEERFLLDIIERVKNECRGTGVDLDRKGYNKHFSHLDGGTSASGSGSQPSDPLLDLYHEEEDSK